MVLIKNPSHDYIYDGYEDVMVETEDVKNIYVYENFISSEDLLKINDYIQSGIFTSDAVHEFPYETLDFTNNEEIVSIIKIYRDKAALLLEEVFDCKVALSEIAGLTKFKTGDNLNEHADKVCASWRDLSTSLYYNEDFEGGELYDPQHVKKIIPKAGLAVLHPGDINYLHGVTPVLSGRRWVTPSFYTVQ